jgi:hypothetical protein
MRALRVNSPCSFGELQTASGVSDRMLQRWVDARILVPIGQEHGGRGHHRQFDRRELIIAVVLRPLADAGTPLGRLVQIGGLLRLALPQRRRSSPATALGNALQRALTGEGANWALFVMGANAVYPGAFSAALGTAPRIDPAFITEAKAAFKTTDPIAVVTIDLAPLSTLD